MVFLCPICGTYPKPNACRCRSLRIFGFYTGDPHPEPGELNVVPYEHPWLDQEALTIYFNVPERDPCLRWHRGQLKIWGERGFRPLRDDESIERVIQEIKAVYLFGI